MHPIFNNRSGLLLYAAVWVPFALMFGFVLALAARLNFAESAIITGPVILLLAILCLSPWYTCRSLPLRSASPWKLLASHFIAAICVSAIVLAFTHMLLAALARMLPDLATGFRPAFPVLANLVLLIYLLSVALHYVLLALESSRRAELLSREAELKALKAQVNPHFLFNSLNSISALTTSEPRKARDMCIRLSEFLRTSLRLGERISIPLSEEVALTKAYLDVEQVRFGSRLKVIQDLDAACGQCEVPPLLVQPLVENAIKHGIATLVEGGEVAIIGRRMRDFIRVSVDNPYDPDAPETRRNGFGLASVQNRLRARYGNAARMEIQAQPSRYTVVLTIPFDTAEGAVE